MLKTILYAIWGLFLAAIPLSSAAAVETQHVRPAGDWLTEPVSDDGDSEIDFCLVRNYYSNGLILILAQDRDGSRRLALNFPGPRLTPGTEHDVTLSVDNIWQSRFNAFAADEDMLVIPLATAPRFWDRLAKGYSLTMKGSNDAVVFDLSGTGAAIESLRECVMSRLSRDPDALPVVAMQEEQDVAAETVESMPPAIPTMIEDILYNAGYKEITPLPLKGDAATRPLDYAWTMNNLFAGFKQLPITGNGNLRKIAEDYFRMVRPICKGPFVAEAAPVYEVAGVPFLRAEAGCSSDVKDTISALLFYRAGEKVTVFFFETSADNGADVIKARDRITRVAEQILAE